jgi:hypothetical protein
LFFFPERDPFFPVNALSVLKRLGLKNRLPGTIPAAQGFRRRRAEKGTIFSGVSFVSPFPGKGVWNG